MNFGFYCFKAHSLNLVMILWKGYSPLKLWLGKKGWNFFFHLKDCREIDVLKEVHPKNVTVSDYLVPLRTNVPVPGKETGVTRKQRKHD